MAKSNPIELLDGAPVTDLAKAVIQAESVSQSLGGLALDILVKADAAKVVVVDFVNRKVRVHAAGVDKATLFTDNFPFATITRDDPTKRSSPMTAAMVEDGYGGENIPALLTAVTASLAASKPSKNLSSLINGVEDALNAMVTLPAGNIYAVIDQAGDGSVTLYSSPAATLGAAVVEEGFKQDADAIIAGAVILPFE